MGRDFTAVTTAAEAPQVEPGLYDMRFDGTSDKVVTGGQWQKSEDGDPKIEWAFTLLDDDGAALYDAGDPIVLSKLTGTSFNFASKTVPGGLKMLKALLTPAEYANFEAGNGCPNEDALIGRKVQGEVFIKESGWPAIGNIIAARAPRRSTNS